MGDFFGVCRWRPSFAFSGELTLIPFPKDLPAGEHTLKESAVAAADGDLGGVRDRVITLKCGRELHEPDLGDREMIIGSRESTTMYAFIPSTYTEMRASESWDSNRGTPCIT